VRLVLLIATALALALAPPASAASFTAHLHAHDHAPKVNQPWPITVTATRGKTKLSGSVKYQFLFQGQVVSRQPGGKFRHGVYRDKLTFPGESVGYKLTLRVLVTTKYGTEHLDWSVKVHK